MIGNRASEILVCFTLSASSLSLGGTNDRLDLFCCLWLAVVTCRSVATPDGVIQYCCVRKKSALGAVVDVD